MKCRHHLSIHSLVPGWEYVGRPPMAPAQFATPRTDAAILRAARPGASSAPP